MKPLVTPAVGTMALLLLACSGEYEAIDLGSSSAAGSGGSGTNVSLGSYEGTWDGFAEDHEFSDGTSRVRLTLPTNGSATLLVGDSSAFIPSTDPNFWSWIVQFGPWPGEPAEHLLIPGFDYPAFPGLKDERLQISIDVKEPYRSWCELQEPIPDAAGTKYRCTPSLPNEQSADGCFLRDQAGVSPTPIDCGKLVLCENMCDCAASGCTATSTRMVLDAALEDSWSLVGTLLPYADGTFQLLATDLVGPSAFRLIQK